jgi:hypothetical protein
VFRTEKPEDLEWAFLRPAEGPHKERLALGIESGDDERSYASLRSDVMLPGSKELDALIRGEKRTAIFEPSPDGLRGCNRIEHLDASESGKLARIPWYRELLCGLGVFESDVHPDVRLGAFCAALG